MTDIQPLIDRYIADDDLAIFNAEFNRISVEESLLGMLIGAMELGTLENWEDLFTPQEIHSLFLALWPEYPGA